MVEVRRVFADNALRNISYVVSGGDGRALVVDPWDAGRIAPLLGGPGARPWAVVNTHEHADHTRGNGGLAERLGLPAWAHPGARGRVPGMARALAHGEEIPLGGGDALRVEHTPGHTMAHLCLLVLEGGRPTAVLTGDTLFNAGVGNCRNGGDPRALYRTVRDFFGGLPDHVLVHPGHDYLENNLGFTLSVEPSNGEARAALDRLGAAAPGGRPPVSDMGAERRVNAFLRLGDRNLLDGLGAGVGDEERAFLRLRELRDRW